MTFTDFLLARIAEDEAAARTDLASDAWGNPYGDSTGIELTFTGERVLAECGAKRQILQRHHSFHVTTRNDGLNWDYRGCSECNEPEDWEPAQGDYWPCPTLTALVSVYAGHPDFDPDWA